ncbi:MAG: type II toxin-antitoxin system VapC family toxin [Thermoplasmata archaeon]
MKNYLLDSSFLIDLINEKKKAIEINEEIKGRELTCTICGYELARYSDKLAEKISEKEMVPFEKNDALEAAAIYQDLKEKGNMIASMDILIGAIARNRNYTLVSSDEDFKEIDDLQLLFYEN